MKKMQTTFYSVPAEVQPYLKKKLKGLPLTMFEEGINRKNVKAGTEILGVFVDAPVPTELLRKMPRLRMIAAMSTGFDHIDMAYAKKHSIPVCNVPTYGENTVAEHAMALLLGLSCRLVDAVNRVKDGSVFDYHGLRGFDLKGKKMGVIGTGHIGLHLIKMAKGFDMSVVAFDPHKNLDASRRLGFTYVPLEKLLSMSDVISLHVPLFKETYHLINKKNIKKVKPGAIIINTARGALIDPEALVWGLETGRVGGAGLDVLEQEDFLQHPERFFYSETKDHMSLVGTTVKGKALKINLMNELIIDHPRTLVTPHNGFNSTEALQRILDTTVDNVTAFLLGHPTNDVTLH